MVQIQIVNRVLFDVYAWKCYKVKCKGGFFSLMRVIQVLASGVSFFCADMSSVED